MPSLAAQLRAIQNLNRKVCRPLLLRTQRSKGLEDGMGCVPPTKEATGVLDVYVLQVEQAYLRFVLLCETGVGTALLLECSNPTVRADVGHLPG